MKIKILQWNIWYKEDLTKTASEIKKWGADVLCFQELYQNQKTSFDAAEKLNRFLDNKYNYFYKEAATWDNRGDHTSQGNGIYSKFPIIKTDYLYSTRFKHNPENAIDEGRVYLEASLDLAGKKLIVGTTHLSFTPYFEITEMRKQQTDNLVRKLKQKRKSFVFAGDLNCTPESYVIKKINKETNLINAGPDLSYKSFPTKPFNYRDVFKEDKLNWRIDYVFVTKDIKVLSSEIIKTEVSDHLPILTEAEI